MKTITKTFILSTLFALVFAVPASAHHVDAAGSTADCTKVIAKYIGFNDNDKPVREKITIDGTVVYDKSNVTWSGSNYSHTINYPNALTSGNHTVTFTATWSTQGSNNGTFTKQVSCGSTSRVNTAASSADCTKVTARYESFVDADKPVSEKITVDGTVVYNRGGHTWSGSSNTHVINYPQALTPGNHSVTFTASWSTQGQNANAFTVNVYCAPPPQTPPSYGCDGKVVDKDHPPATCPGPSVEIPVPGPTVQAPAPTVTPNSIICIPKGTLVLYTKRSTILVQRVYVNGKLMGTARPNANSHRQRFVLPANTGPEYSMRIVAKLRSQKNGRVFRWTKTVKVKRCGVAPARARHIDP